MPQPVAKQPHAPLPHLPASVDAVTGRCVCVVMVMVLVLVGGKGMGRVEDCCRRTAAEANGALHVHVCA